MMLTIVFERVHSQVGDTTIAIKGLYALRALYQDAKIIVICSQTGHTLYKGLQYEGSKLVDEFIILNIQEKDKSTKINEFKAALASISQIDILILCLRSSWTIKAAKASHARKVITELHMRNLLSWQFVCPFMIISYFVHGSQKILRLVRQINPKHYDQNIAHIDFSKARIQTLPKHQSHITKFLLALNAHDKKAIIGINPFGSSNAYNFALEDWIALGLELASCFPAMLFIFLTHKIAFPLPNLQMPPPPRSITDKKASPSNLAIFVNDDDLFNLIELTSRLSLLLSLNTGNIHIADNLCIKTLSLCPSKERINCIGGSYGGEFEGVFLPKQWKKNYAHYYAEFKTKALQNLQKLSTKECNVSFSL